MGSACWRGLWSGPCLGGLELVGFGIAGGAGAHSEAVARLAHSAQVHYWGFSQAFRLLKPGTGAWEVRVGVWDWSRGQGYWSAAERCGSSSKSRLAEVGRGLPCLSVPGLRPVLLCTRSQGALGRAARAVACTLPTAPAGRACGRGKGERGGAQGLLQLLLVTRPGAPTGVHLTPGPVVLSSPTPEVDSWAPELPLTH